MLLMKNDKIITIIRLLGIIFLVIGIIVIFVGTINVARIMIFSSVLLNTAGLIMKRHKK